MKKSFTHLAIFGLVLYGFQSAFSQPCNIQITGGNCLGNSLSADFSTGTLSSVSWKNFGGIEYIADTITNSESVSIVAGGRGNGNLKNQFGFPGGGIAIDKSGNIYVADSKNNRVQKWAPSATEGTTVAGSNTVGYDASHLYYPKDVFVDTAGNIYVADSYNHRIQKWAPGATAGTTVAGGNGIGSGANQLNNPLSACVDLDGNIYIVDAGNYRIQKWAPGAIRGTTIGGSGFGFGTTQFVLPVYIRLDSDNNIYVADQGVSIINGVYNRIRRWVKTTRIYETIAGGVGDSDAANHLNNITSFFIDKNRNLYITDAGNRRIQKWAPGASTGTTVAGGYGIGNQPRQIYYATGVSLGPDSNIYVMDGANYAVKKFIPTNGIVNNKLTPKQAGVYRVEATFKNGCTTISNPFTVYSKPSPEILITPGSSRGNLCPGSIDTFFVNPWDEISTYNWIVPKSCTVLADLEDTIVIKVPANFYFGRLINVGTNVCGVGIPDTMNLFGRPLAPSSLRGRTNVHPYELNLVYSVEDLGLSYHWTVVPAAVSIVSGQGTSSIVVAWTTLSDGVISVEATNACGTSGVKRKNIYALSNKVLSRPTTVSEGLVTKILHIYPIPSSSIATITYEAAESSRYMVELMDFAGRLVMKKNIQLKQGMNTFSVEMEKFSKGIYTVVLTNEKYERVFGKIVK